MFKVKVNDSFDAAHFLKKTGTKCDNLHGHTWNVWITLQSRNLAPKGWVINFTLVKKWLKQILEGFDHNILNFYLRQPTAENLCYVIFRYFHFKLYDYNIRTNLEVMIEKVEIAETPKNIAIFSCYDIDIRNGWRTRRAPHTKETIEKIRKGNKGKNLGKKPWNYGLTKELDKRLIHSEEQNRKISISVSKKQKENWQNPEFVKKMMKAWGIKPNRVEKKLEMILNKVLSGQYKYVGDGQFILGGKIPDFISNGDQKKIIELFGDYWHGEKRTGISNEQHEQQRVNHFARYGYQTLIIWEHELKNIKELKKKILNFHKKF